MERRNGLINELNRTIGWFPALDTSMVENIKLEYKRFDWTYFSGIGTILSIPNSPAFQEVGCSFNRYAMTIGVLIRSGTE